MLTLTEIANRIKKLKNLTKDKEVAELLGFEARAFATAKSRNSIPYRELTSFCSIYKISLNWLLTGEGSPSECVTEEEALPYLSPLERVYVGRLLEIFRTKDQGTVSAITQNIDTFLRVPSVKEERPPFTEEAGEGKKKRA